MIDETMAMVWQAMQADKLITGGKLDRYEDAYIIIEKNELGQITWRGKPIGMPFTYAMDRTPI